jgi:branched-chain amino acid transport system permease protein
MILLGGVGSFLGPVVGAAAFKILDTVATAYLHYWGAVLGAVLTGLVLVFPQGLLGARAQSANRAA